MDRSDGGAAMSATRVARMRKAQSMRVRCVMCGAKKTIELGQIAPGDHPMCCEACLGPMVPIVAERR